jgi:hypothetical protein
MSSRKVIKMCARERDLRRIVNINISQHKCCKERRSRSKSLPWDVILRVVKLAVNNADLSRPISLSSAIILRIL